MDAKTGLDLFNAITTAAKNIWEIAQGIANADTKKQLIHVYDELMNLKRQANDLEDENRNLKEKLRFRSGDFEFKNPFWYENTHPDKRRIETQWGLTDGLRVVPSPDLPNCEMTGGIGNRHLQRI